MMSVTVMTCCGTTARSHAFNHPYNSNTNMMNRVALLLLKAPVRRSRIMPRKRKKCRPSSPFILVKSYYAILLLVLLVFPVTSRAFHLYPNTGQLNPYLISEEYFLTRFCFGTTTSASHTVLSYSVPIVKGSEDYDLDAIEKEMNNETSSQRPKFDKSSRFNKKRNKTRRRNSGRPITCSVKPTDKASNSTYSGKAGPPSAERKKDRRKPKTLEDVQIMPPWLSRYENEDFATTPFYIGDASQPSTSVLKPTERDKSHMQRLYLALNGIFRHAPTSETFTSSSSIDFAPDAIPYFTKNEIHNIMDAIRVASNGNTNLMAGCADFLYLMLTLEEEGVLIRTGASLNNEPWDDDEISSAGNFDWENGPERIGDGQPEPFSIMTRDVLVAAAFHYCDCVRARKAGVYEYARQAMEASLDLSSMEEPVVGKWKQLPLPPRVDHLDGADIDTKGPKDGTTAAIVESDATVIDTKNNVGNSPIVKIVAGAARLKRAEIMATTVNSNGRLVSNGARSKSSVNAEILRSFLVSLSEDWRALVIRSAACLYRLKGITENMDDAVDNRTNVSAASSALTKSTSVVARDAFKVYAPLAQRLGMQRLKSELENRAFRILYPRQYSVASSLYSTGMDEMKSIAHVLSSRIEELLKSDQVFIDQVEEVTVDSRVKEPYSLWRKMVRYRKEAAGAKNVASPERVDRQFVPSLKWIPDVIALRVVLRARRLSSLEDDESLSTREKMMCYYALQIISDVWPPSTLNKAKDYIKYPKPNGYQSLHYTASLSIAEEEWPFEVQIRSEEMNRVAEFGVAAHWDYKLQNKGTESLSGSSRPGKFSSKIPLLPELKSDDKIVMNNLSRATQKGRIASYIDALAASRETIVKNNVFVFLSSTERAIDGNIVCIDPSATQVAEVLKKFGVNMDEKMLNDISTGNLPIYRNGLSTSLDEELYNGDVLTLPRILVDSLLI